MADINTTAGLQDELAKLGSMVGINSSPAGKASETKEFAPADAETADAPVTKTEAYKGKNPVYAKKYPEIPMKRNKDTKAYEPRTEDEQDAWCAKQETREIKDTVQQNLYKSSQQAVSPLQREIRDLITARLRIVGYVTAKGDKVDFTTSSVTTTDSNGKESREYNIILKNTAPSAIQYAIIKEPTALISLLKQSTAEGAKLDAITEQFNIYKNTPPREESFSIVYIPWSGMVAYLMENTNGTIQEAPEIFTTYVKGAKEPVVYEKPEDIKAHNGVPAGSCLYLSAKLGKIKKNKDTQELDTRSVVTLKHSVRSKIITPANVVPLKRFQTVSPATTYAKDDAAQMIQLYLSKYNKEQKTAGTTYSVCTSLHKDCKEFKVADRQIVSTSYFATAGDTSWFSDAAHTIDHWYNKNPDGSAKVISGPNIKLVKKETVTTKKGTERIVTATDDLCAADTAGDYQFTSANFPNVFSAAGVLKLNFEDLSKAIAANKQTKARMGKSGKTKKQTYVEPGALIGLSLDTIAQQLESAFGVDEGKAKA